MSDSWGLRVFDGLNRDIEQLMDSFVKTVSVRYEVFSKLWRDMNFSLVYCGLKTMEHTREFVEEALRLSTAYLSSPFEFQQRTGGLYLLYAFYFTQRHVPKLKVRLSLQQWEDLKELEAEFKAQGHLDASYILLKLKAAKAFSFVHDSKQFSFYKGYFDDSSDKMAAELQRDLEQAFPEGLLRKLHETHFQYQLLKNQLGVSENLNHVTKSMAEVIANRFQDSDDDEDGRNDKSTKGISHGDRVAALKAKSYSFGVEGEMSRTNQFFTEQRQDPSYSTKKIQSSDQGRRSSSKLRITVDPDNRHLVDKLMPTLQTYDVSESDEDLEQEAKSLPPADKNKESPKIRSPKARKKQKRNIAKADVKVTPRLSPRMKNQSPRKKNQSPRKRKR